MTEIHDVVADTGNTYKIRYTRTLKDIEGKDVVVFATTKIASIDEIQQEIDTLNIRKTNIENSIAKLQTEISEITKI